MYGYIYKTTNLINGKIYIGQHKSKTFTDYKGSGKILWKAINKYGWDNFKVELLVECNSQEELNSEEKRFIKEYDSTNKSIGYNLSLGGQNPVLIGENNPLYGKHRSQKVRDQISKTKTGVKKTPEQVARMSETTKNLYKNNKEFVKKRSESQKVVSTGRRWIHKDNENKFVTPEDYEYYINEGWVDGMAYRPRSEKYKEYCRNKTHSEETCKKISKSHEGRTCINNSTNNKFVKPEDLQWYLDNGWVQGMIR